MSYETKSMSRESAFNPFGEGLPREHDLRPTSTTERVQAFLSQGHDFLGKGLDQELSGACWQLKTRGLFAFIKSAPMAAADRVSLLPSMFIKAIDSTIDKRFDGPFSTIPRMLLLVASALIRAMLFIPTFCVVLTLCLAGTITGVLPAAFALKSCFSSPKEFNSEYTSLPDGAFVSLAEPRSPLRSNSYQGSKLDFHE